MWWMSILAKKAENAPKNA